MTQWCISTLTERLEKLKIAISNDIEVCFFNVKATGEVKPRMFHSRHLF